MVEYDMYQIIQMVSWLATAAGVCFAAYYYVMTLRNTERIRKRDQVFQRLQTDPQWFDTIFDIMYNYSDFKNVEEFRSKHSRFVDPGAHTKIYYVLNQYNSLGILLKEGLIDADLLFQLHTPWTFASIYKKYELPCILTQGISPDGVIYDPLSYYGIKYLYAEVKKRYPTLTMGSAINQDEFVKRGGMFDEFFKKNPQLIS
jgi:hypothetical protein